MKDCQSKPLPPPAADVPEAVGFGKLAGHPVRPCAASDADGATGGDLQPAAGERSRKAKPDQDPTRAALYRDALASARTLKRKHRVYYAADQKGFRAVVKKAQARVFRLKPGPVADARIAGAARHRASGANWPELYPRHIEHYATMPEFTRDLAEAGFRRKVNAYLQHHPYLRRRLLKKTSSVKSLQSS